MRTSAERDDAEDDQLEPDADREGMVSLLASTVGDPAPTGVMTVLRRDVILLRPFKKGSGWESAERR
jgi:hypothetical protein